MKSVPHLKYVYVFVSVVIDNEAVEKLAIYTHIHLNTCAYTLTLKHRTVGVKNFGHIDFGSS